jgi:short-subunit dehydrogenase
MSNSRKVALVTGASAGLGSAFARAYARRGYDLILVARRKDRLEALARELKDQHGANSLVVAADLTDPAAPEAIERAAAEAGWQIDVLINNAGFSTQMPFSHETLDGSSRYLQALMIAPVQLVIRLLPAMIARGSGQILNVASIAGLTVGLPGTAFYGATKSFLIKWSEALNAELAHHGIQVTALCPGPTETDFVETAGPLVQREMAKVPKYMFLSADACAAIGIEALERNTPVVVSGRWSRLMVLLGNILPKRMVWAGIRKQAEQLHKDFPSPPPKIA